jgi:hypothetical protein
VPTVIVKIIGEWFPDPEVGVRRVARGIFPECHVGNVPVLVTWGAQPTSAADNEKVLRAFREIVGGEGILVVAGPEGGDGWIRVDTTLSQPQRDAALIAAAVIKVAWGWDEAGRIRIEDQSGSLLVAVDFDAKEACFRASLIVSAMDSSKPMPKR